MSRKHPYRAIALMLCVSYGYAIGIGIAVAFGSWDALGFVLFPVLFQWFALDMFAKTRCNNPDSEKEVKSE